MEPKIKVKMGNKAVVVKSNYYSDTVMFALALVFFGTAWLGFNVGWFPVIYKPIVISWQMLLILVSLASYLKGHWNSGTILLLIGLFFIMPKIGEAFPDAGIPDVNFRTYWPVLLIVAGIMSIGGMFRKKRKHHLNKNYTVAGTMEDNDSRSRGFQENSDRIEKDVAFNSNHQIILSSDFYGGEVNVIFGEMIMDLTRVASLNPGNRLEVCVAFGSAIIYVPRGWIVNIMKSETFAGAVEDDRDRESGIPGDAPVLNLKCSVAFGSIAIKN